jgi:hypothetical protein
MIGKIVNGYFIAPDSGLAFKIHLINMGDYSNDMGKIRDEVNRINALYAGDANVSLAVIGLLPNIWQKAANDLPAITEEIGSKSLPFVYLSKTVADPENTPLPWGFFEKCFVWNGSDDNVWSNFDSNGLHHRFKVIQADQIPDAPTTGTTPATPPVVTVSSSVNLRLECLKLACDVAIQLKPANSGAVQEQPIFDLADKFLVYVKKVA